MLSNIHTHSHSDGSIREQLGVSIQHLRIFISRVEQPRFEPPTLRILAYPGNFTLGFLHYKCGSLLTRVDPHGFLFFVFFFLLLAANKFIIILLFVMIQKNYYCTCWPHIKFVLIWNFIFSLYSQTLKQHIVCKWMKKKIKTKTVRRRSCSEFGFKISWKNQIFYDSLKKNNSIKIRCCTLPKPQSALNVVY